MKASEIKAGQKIIFTQTGEEFTIAKVTDKRISWHIDFEYRSYRNTMKMVWVSVNKFQEGLDSGAYQIVTK